MGKQSDEVARRLGQTNTSELTAVGPEQVRHIEHVADWYAQQGIIRSKPDIGTFVVDFSK